MLSIHYAKVTAEINIGGHLKVAGGGHMTEFSVNIDHLEIHHLYVVVTNELHDILHGFCHFCMSSEK